MIVIIEAHYRWNMTNETTSELFTASRIRKKRLNGHFDLLASGIENTHLEPANIEEKLQESEDRKVEVEVVALIALSGVKKLPTNQTSQEETVHSHSYHLE